MLCRNILLVVLVILSINTAGCNYYKNAKVVEVGIKMDTSNNNNSSNLSSGNNSGNGGYLFNLSDKEINEAIDTGKKNYHQINTYLDRTYNLVPEDSKYNTLAEAKIVTPYHFIMSDAAFKRSLSKDDEFFESGRELHFKSAKDYLKASMDGKSIVLKIKLYGNDIECHKSTTIAIFQKDKTIQTMVIGLENQAKKTMNQSDFLPYYREVSIMINSKNGDIDFSNKAQLKIITESKEEIVFEIDFSKYK